MAPEQDGTVRLDDDGTLDFNPVVRVGRAFTRQTSSGSSMVVGRRRTVWAATQRADTRTRWARCGWCQPRREFLPLRLGVRNFEGDLSVNGEDARLTVRGSIVELLFGGAIEVTAGAGLSVQGDIDY